METTTGEALPLMTATSPLGVQARPPHSVTPAIMLPPAWAETATEEEGVGVTPTPLALAVAMARGQPAPLPPVPPWAAATLVATAVHHPPLQPSLQPPLDVMAPGVGVAPAPSPVWVTVLRTRPASGLGGTLTPTTPAAVVVVLRPGLPPAPAQLRAALPPAHHPSPPGSAMPAPLMQ